MPTTITHNNKTYEVIDTNGTLSLKEVFTPYWTWRIVHNGSVEYYPSPSPIIPEQGYPKYAGEKCFISKGHHMDKLICDDGEIWTPFYVDSPETHGMVQSAPEWRAKF